MRKTLKLSIILALALWGGIQSVNSQTITIDSSVSGKVIVTINYSAQPKVAKIHPGSDKRQEALKPQERALLERGRELIGQGHGPRDGQPGYRMGPRARWDAPSLNRGNGPGWQGGGRGRGPGMGQRNCPSTK